MICCRRPLTIGEVELRETRVGDHSGRVRSGTHFWRVHGESDGRCLVRDTRHWPANPPNSGSGGRECHAGGLRGYNSCLPALWGKTQETEYKTQILTMKQCRTRRRFVISVTKWMRTRLSSLVISVTSSRTFLFSSYTRAVQGPWWAMRFAGCEVRCVQWVSGDPRLSKMRNTMDHLLWLCQVRRFTCDLRITISTTKANQTRMSPTETHSRSSMDLVQCQISTPRTLWTLGVCQSQITF